MGKIRRSIKTNKIISKGMVRASSSYPRELYQTLEEIAREKKVSIAWVMRDAAEKYVAERWPLFNVEKG
ncbi:MAG: ribbon-helix-helix protein, CopG family [Nitrospira sp.]|nr:ribbon-helix-helix protein, CopG family [Nitrospira sp.]